MFTKLSHEEVRRILDNADLPGKHEIDLFLSFPLVPSSASYINLHTIVNAPLSISAKLIMKNLVNVNVVV